MVQKEIGYTRTKLKKVKITYTRRLHQIDNKDIQLSRYDKNRKITFPKVLTPELAEEIGIHIGDGFLSNKKFDYRVKGDKEEKEYYDRFIKKLYKKLFNVDLNIKEYEETYGFELYSKGIWMFKTKSLGIEPGRKDNLTFPGIIQVNNKEILCGFIRGLFDTDGSLDFKSQGEVKEYYPRLSITLISKNIIDEAEKILAMFGLKPYKYVKKGGYWQIILNGYKRLERYYDMVGWNNPKHLKKLKAWKKRHPKLARNITI